MRILIDTNIFINREENIIISSNLQKLLEILNHLNHQLIIHPLSIKEISKDSDEKRRAINLSKISTYLQLENPPKLDQRSPLFKSVKLNQSSVGKNEVDMNLLYCIMRNSAHLLLTEDKRMLNKAKKLGISDKVVNISDALKKFDKPTNPHTIKLSTSPAIQEVPVHNLDLDDPFFDSLKEDYPEFVHWWKKISMAGRKAWVYFKNKKLGAILIYKIENESIHSTPPLPKKKRIKICTLKVTQRGKRIGELLIKLTISFAVKCNINEIYLTHFTKANDPLLTLISEYGFHLISKKEKNEEIFIKKLIPDEKCETPLEVLNHFYPSFYDGEKVRKFLVPIQPDFHDRLFTDYDKRQPKLYEFMEELIVEGNTIKKAYICHANTRKIHPGDVLVFYRSIDRQMLTSLGVVDKVFNDVLDPDKVQKEVKNRTVYQRREIEKMVQKPTKIILFYHTFHFPNKIKINTLLSENIINGYPQSIQEITDENYQRIIELSGLDKKYFIKELKIM